MLSFTAAKTEGVEPSMVYVEVGVSVPMVPYTDTDVPVVRRRHQHKEGETASMTRLGNYIVE